MKKSILFAMFLGGVFAANAQNTNTTAGPATGNVTLNVNLYPLQSIVINTGQKTVDLDYITAANYENGVNKDQANHLKVFSTGAFEVNVNSKTDKLTSGPDDTINASDITITPSAGLQGNLSGLSYTAQTLGTDPKLIVESTAAGSGEININYAAKGDLNKYLLKYTGINGAVTTYTTQVEYSIVAK